MKLLVVLSLRLANTLNDDSRDILRRAIVLGDLPGMEIFFRPA